MEASKANPTVSQAASQATSQVKTVELVTNEFYKILDDLTRKIPFDQLQFDILTRKGILSTHSEQVMFLYLYFLRLSDFAKYKQILKCPDDKAVRELIPGMTTYCKGVKSFFCYSHNLPIEFLRIINAYIYFIENYDS